MPDLSINTGDIREKSAIENNLSPRQVRAAAISIIPWTIGSLMSPLGEPHPLLLALPPVALVLFIAVIRMRLPVRRRWISSFFCILLLGASATRFLVIPVLTHVLTGGSELDESGRALQGLYGTLTGVMLAFYTASLGLFLFSAFILLRRAAGGNLNSSESKKKLSFSRRLTLFRRRIRALLIRSAIFLIGSLPMKTARRMGRLFGMTARLFMRRDRKLAEEHLKIAFPGQNEEFISQTSKKCFANLGENFFELCVVHKNDAGSAAGDDGNPGLMNSEVVEDYDIEALEEAISEGKGCIVVTGHIGSWEMAARALVARGLKVTAAARRFHDPWLGELIDEIRRGGGVDTLQRGAPGTIRGILENIRSGGAVFMLVDQDTDVPSVFSPFFGIPAKTPKAPAELALRTGAALVAGFIHREKPLGNHRMRAIRIFPEKTGKSREEDVLALTATINSLLEKEIREYPEDWVWFHRRWKSVPEKELPEKMAVLNNEG